MPENLLYYGDNLDILRNHLADDSVDLVYLDPPFNSNASYNVLFAEQNGSRGRSVRGGRGKRRQGFAGDAGSSHRYRDRHAPAAPGDHREGN